MNTDCITIHFRGEPAPIAISFEGGDIRKTCIPIVFETPIHSGVGLLYDGEDGKGLFWGHSPNRDLIASWRATLIAPLLESIGDSTLCAAYLTGTGEAFDATLRALYIHPIIQAIGRDAYDRIMATPVPDAIVRLILDKQSDAMPPSLTPIVREVRRGTIPWREEFEKAGLEHPSVIDERQRRYDEILAAYALLLDELRRKIGNINVSDALLYLVTKSDVEKHHSKRIVVALALFIRFQQIGALICRTFSLPTRQVDEEFRSDQRIAACEISAKWLVTGWSFTPCFWRPRGGNYSRFEAVELLNFLFDEQITKIARPHKIPDATSKPTDEASPSSPTA